MNVVDIVMGESGDGLLGWSDQRVKALGRISSYRTSDKTNTMGRSCTAALFADGYTLGQKDNEREPQLQLSVKENCVLQRVSQSCGR